MTTKLSCSTCGGLIMPITASRTGGLCMPCFSKIGAKRPRYPGVPHATNKARFACFACRKTYKQLGSSTWDLEVPDRQFPCPQCKEPMARMGRHFKAPPQRSTRAWREVREKFMQGERFN